MLPYFEFFCIQKDLQSSQIFTFDADQQQANKINIYNEQIKEDLMKCENLINFLEKNNEIKETVNKIDVEQFDICFQLLEQYSLIAQKQKIRIIRVFTYYLINQIANGLIAASLLHEEQSQQINDKLILFFQELIPQLQHEVVSQVVEVLLITYIAVIQVLPIQQQMQQTEALFNQLGLSIHKNVRKIILQQLQHLEQKDHSATSEIVLRQQQIFNQLLSDQANINQIVQLIGHAIPLSQALQTFSNYKYIFIAQNQKILKAAYKCYNKLQLEDIYQICLSNKANYTLTQFIIEQSGYEPIQSDIQDLIKQTLNYQQLILIICLLNMSNSTLELNNSFIQQLLQENNLQLIQYITNQQLLDLLQQNIQQNKTLQLMPACYPKDEDLQQSIEVVNQLVAQSIDINTRISLLQQYILLLLRMKEKQQLNSSCLLEQLLNNIDYTSKMCLEQIDVNLENIKQIYTFLSIIYRAFPKLLQACQQIDSIFLRLFICMYDHKYNMYEQLDQETDQQQKKQIEYKVKQIDDLSVQAITGQKFPIQIKYIVASLDLPVFQTLLVRDIINDIKQNICDSLIQYVVQTIKIIQNEEIIKQSKYLQQNDLITDLVSFTNHIYSQAIKIDQQWGKDQIKCAVITQKMGVIGIGKKLNQKTQQLIQTLVNENNQNQEQHQQQ